MSFFSYIMALAEENCHPVAHLPFGQNYKSERFNVAIKLASTSIPKRSNISSIYEPFCNYTYDV